MIRSQLRDPGQLDALLASGRFLLFKHSQRCSTSSHAFREYRLFVQAHPEVRHGWIDVVAQRDWARQIAQKIGVPHQSPQALVIENGRVLWHDSHFGITQRSLAEHVLDGAATLPKPPGG